MSAASGPMVQVTAGGYRWLLPPEYRDCLVGPQGLRLDEWLATGQAQIVKSGPHRTVYHVSLPNLDFYLKHFRLMDTRAWLREMVRPPKARMEFDRAIAVAARDVPTITPLGVGVGCAGPGPCDSFLIVRSLFNVEPLNAFLENTLPSWEMNRQTRFRLQLPIELGRMIARIHQNGIFHHDLHSGNLLIGLEPGDKIQLYMIDLHAVHLGRPLTWRTSRDNLVILNRWFILRAERTDRLRFWKAYFEARKQEFAKNHSGVGVSFLFAELARELESRTWQSNLRFWCHRDRRCRENNRHYARVRSRAAIGFAVRDLDRHSLRVLLANPDSPFHQPGVQVLKDSPSSTVAEWKVPLNGMIRKVIYKKFRITSWTDPLVNGLRLSPALRSWIYGQGLRERCLSTARPLAMFHRRRFGLPWEGYLLTEKIEGAVDLSRWLKNLKNLPRLYRFQILSKLIEKVARLIRDLHQRQLSHRDLKSANILVSRIDHRGSRTEDEKSNIDSENGIPARDFDPGSSILDLRIWLIDLVGVMKYQRLPYSRRVQNLGRLNASFVQNTLLSRTDKLRFLRVYLQWGLKGRKGWKKWWKNIEQATRAKVQKNLRNGRAIA